MVDAALAAGVVQGVGAGLDRFLAFVRAGQGLAGLRRFLAILRGWPSPRQTVVSWVCPRSGSRHARLSFRLLSGISLCQAFLRVSPGTSIRQAVVRLSSGGG